jgi:nucleotide-binding universal stress UspA family protein
MGSPWRHILCLIEFEDDGHKSLTAASQSALCYATTLAVTHRAQVTAFHLVPKLPDTAAEHQKLLEQVRQDVRSLAVGQTTPGLVDVHAVAGTTNEDLLQSAREIRADLIVLGRREGGAACLLQLREMLREAPCHVLVVHPSGQAAVA